MCTWRVLYERERERADALEAEFRKLSGSNRDALYRAGSMECRLDRCRDTREELKRSNRELRRRVSGRWDSSAGWRRDRETIRWQQGRMKELHGKLQFFRPMGEMMGPTLDESRRLRSSLRWMKWIRDGLDGQLEKSERRVSRLSRTLSGRDGDLRRSLRRSRRQKSTIRSLTKENARLRRREQASMRRIGVLESELAKVRSSRAVLSNRLYGRKSERQDRPGTGRPRGHQRGKPGHGRTPRPELEDRVEERNPPADARKCDRCGESFVRNGAEVSTLVEIEVKAHRRVIRRPRWRPGCACDGAPVEVLAPPAPRLFPCTHYGTGFWACFLFERYDCLRPLERVAAWMSDHGLPVSPGTLADSVKRFEPLFGPIAEAILSRQKEDGLRQADETTWRVQELRGEDRSSRAWLWVSATGEAAYFHIDPSRSVEAAAKLFAGLDLCTVIVCDRYSVYKALARRLGGMAVLAFCWGHVRRDFIDGAAGQERLAAWCRKWIEWIAELYRLNGERLAHHKPNRKRQTAAFRATEGRLKAALDGFFAEAERELGGLPQDAREARALRSLLKHREGLSVFVDWPQVPMDNNFSERLLRGPAIGRRLSLGSDSERGARFTAVMYSVVATLRLNGVDVLKWLKAWLEACAANGGRPPDDLSAWLPWKMGKRRRRELAAPG
ncbi:MAG: IS66 family transposase [Gammaproteobacteria bacterium]|nr:IS66 family transposase [Gammaproteobacteria bacterium]